MEGLMQPVSQYERLQTNYSSWPREGPASFQAKLFSCTYCSYQSPRKDLLNKHLRTHTGEKPYKCRFCDKRSTQKSNMMTHELTHFNSKKHQRS